MFRKVAFLVGGLFLSLSLIIPAAAQDTNARVRVIHA